MESSSNVIASPTIAAPPGATSCAGSCSPRSASRCSRSRCRRRDSRSPTSTRCSSPSVAPPWPPCSPCRAAGVARAAADAGAQWRSLAIVAFGVVVGFPLLTALALRDVDSSHGAVVIALLPACTAVFAVLRAGETPVARLLDRRPAPASSPCSPSSPRRASARSALADLELLAGTVVCSLAYAEGGALSRTLGGPQTICWALVLSAPLSIPITLAFLPRRGRRDRRVAGLRLRLGVLDVPRLLRLVRGPRARRRGEGRADPAAPDAAHARARGARPRRAHHGPRDGLHRRRAREHRRHAAGARWCDRA